MVLLDFMERNDMIWLWWTLGKARVDRFLIGEMRKKVGRHAKTEVLSYVHSVPNRKLNFGSFPSHRTSATPAFHFIAGYSRLVGSFEPALRTNTRASGTTRGFCTPAPAPFFTFITSTYPWTLTCRAITVSSWHLCFSSVNWLFIRLFIQNLHMDLYICINLREAITWKTG